MGCDIHMVIEAFYKRKKKYKGHWVAIKVPRYPHPSMERNYDRFAALAGVRGDGPDPLGVPPDASDTTRYLIAEEWGPDGHSHSYMNLRDAARIFLATEFQGGKHLKDYERGYPVEHYFDVPDADGRQTRMVFWFDN